MKMKLKSMLPNTLGMAVLAALATAGAQTAQATTYNFTTLPDTLGGSPSYASGINDSGTVVGYADNAAGHFHAFSYSGSAMTDLGTLGGSSSYANGINDSGTVVGKADNAVGNFHAFSDSNGSMSDLNNLTANLPIGFTLTDASAINTLGDIVGTGYNASGNNVAFLLTPVPEPASLALLALGGWGLLLKRGKKLRVSLP